MSNEDTIAALPTDANGAFAINFHRPFPGIPVVLVSNGDLGWSGVVVGVMASSVTPAYFSGIAAVNGVQVVGAVRVNWSAAMAS